jgi:hypothetical protein
MRGGLLLACSVTVVLCAVRGATADEAADQLARYRAWMEHPSLYMRYRGRREYAETGTLAALKVLSRSYARPEEPKDQVRYLLASLCADHFRAPPDLETLRAWRRRHAHPEDAWLWFRVLGAEYAIDGPAELVASVRDTSRGVLRAAALEALIEARDPSVLSLATEVLDALPSKPLVHMALLGSCAQALQATRAQRRTDPWRAAARALLPAFEEPGLPDGVRLALARRLQLALGADRPSRDADVWRALLDGKPAPHPKADGRYAPPRRPRFLGLEAGGDRVVYVIDMSDSMLTPLTGKEVEDLKRTPAPPSAPSPVVTGGAGAAPKKGGAAPAAPRADPRVLGLPWDRIRTRFDAARAFLELSLRALPPEAAFAVVGFGSEATLLDATPGLRRARPRNVERACAELDAIQAGSRTKARPYGTLRGYTNLHGGLQRAFQVRARGLTRKPEYVDPATFVDGCDTIFLLSDGKPTWDDWPAWDKRLPGQHSGDPESGAQVKDRTMGHYYGPYALSSVLRDDVRRMGLFRKVEIHCVGLGEDDPFLLKWLADTTLGRFRQVGAR